MTLFAHKPEWRDETQPLSGLSWRPTPFWATHILATKGADGVTRYTWAEKFGEHYLGEPRYRGGVQSRACFTIGPDAWQVVEARPAAPIKG